jgi:hypothetical protein
MIVTAAPMIMALTTISFVRMMMLMAAVVLSNRRFAGMSMFIQDGTDVVRL